MAFKGYFKSNFQRVFKTEQEATRWVNIHKRQPLTKTFKSVIKKVDEGFRVSVESVQFKL